MSDQKIPVEISGQQFRIAPPSGDEERLRRAVAFLAHRINEIQGAGVISSHRAALLAGLEVSMDLLALREDPKSLSEEEVAEARARLERVLGDIDRALGSA